MLEKANKKVGIFDVNDKSKEKIYHKIRMGSFTKDEYLKKSFPQEFKKMRKKQEKMIFLISL